MMPKIRRERVRRHVAAAGASEPSEETNPVLPEEKASLLFTGTGIVWEPIKPLDLAVLTSLSNTKQEDVAMSDSKSDVSSHVGSHSGEKKSESNVESGSAEGKRPLKKQTKREKIQARHQKFMTRLMLPGDKQKFETKKLDLSALAEVIDAKEPPAASLKMTSYTRKSVAASEINQFKLVFQHPAFQNDALAAIREHLQIANAAREEAESAKSGPAKNKKPLDRHHPYTKPLEPKTDTRSAQAPKSAQALPKPNPNKGKHTRKKGRAETFRKR